jgi:hypothetical protein
MPWVTATAPFLGSFSVNGIDGGRDGIITALLGVVVGVIALVFRTRPTNAGTAVGLGITAAITVIIGVVDLYRLNDALHGLDTAYVSARAGSGLYVTIAAGIAGIVAAFLHRPPGPLEPDRRRPSGQL